MASIYNIAKSLWFKGDLDLEGADLRFMLVSTAASGTFNADLDYVSQGPVAAELSGTGYAGGHGGSGRKTVQLGAVTQDNDNNLAYWTASGVNWTGLDAGTVGAVVLVRAGTSDDTDAVLIAHYSDSFPVVTNGGLLSFTPPAAGFVKGV